MADKTTSVKARILTALDAALDPTGGPQLVPKARIFPRTVEALPALPFIRYEADATPYEHTCGAGSTSMVRLHVFTSGEIDCEKICAAIVEALSALTGVQSSLWRGTQFIPTDEASEWHGIVDFQVVETA